MTTIESPALHSPSPAVETDALIYLDNGATAQKPLAVLEALREQRLDLQVQRREGRRGGCGDGGGHGALSAAPAGVV